MNVLLVRPDGIGDEILCLPVAAALRREHPGGRIAFMSSVYAAPILAHHPDIDEVVTVSGQESFSRIVSLFRRGYDAAVFLKPFRRLMLAAFVARVPCRVATGYRWYSYLANRRVYEHRHDFSKHEVVYNLGLLKGLGCAPGEAQRPRLVLQEHERAWAHDRLRDLPPTRVVLHPGGRSPRHWRAEHYRSLAEDLAGHGIGVIITGAGDEDLAVAEGLPVPGRSAGGVLNLMGQVSLRELMAVIGACQCVVSGSTGPAHIAAALDVPTVSIFDPRRMSLPIRWRPIGEGFVLQPDVPTCEKCVYEACPYWDCLDRISVQHVTDHVRRVIKEPELSRVLHV